MTLLDLDVTAEEKTDIVLVPYVENSDPSLRTHIVNPPNNLHLFTHPEMTAQDIVDLARSTGQEVVALCGYKWVPVHNPDKYDMCDQCMTLAQHIMRKLGE